MPLSKQVTFKTRLQRWGKLQIPINVRVCYELEPAQMLKVTLGSPAVWGAAQVFYAKMREDGRIDIPKIVLASLGGKRLPEHCVLEVTLEPA